MAPETVVSPSDPFTAYPGGVIVLKCAEWLGAARGTLSTEADARSCSGTVVRDSQTVAASIFTSENTNATTSLAQADDTLVVDMGLLPIEEDFLYYVFVSLLIEGDWDASNSDTTRGGHQEMFNMACQGSWWQNTFPADLSPVRGLAFKPRGIDSYRIVGWETSPTIQSTDELTFRVYAQSGTTCEFLLDQIYFVPSVTNTAGEWDPDDFAFVPGNWSISGIGGIGDGFVDGADGGDDNGKFTWHPTSFDDYLGFSGGVGGDYQKDPLDEYCIRVMPDDIFIWNSVTSTEANCEGYGIHGPFYVPQQIWTTDDFSRTLGDGNFGGALNHFVTQNWGDTPEGFAWRSDGNTGPTALGQGVAVWVDGAEGVMETRGGGDTRTARCFLRSYGGETGPNLGADIRADNFIISGEFRATETGAGTSIARAEIATENPATTNPNQQPVIIVFDMNAGTWNLEAADATVIDGPFTAGFWGFGSATVGWKIEIKRYLVRARVWDASGAEPSTWDVETFRPMLVGGSAVAYDYADDLNDSILEADPATVFVRLTSTGTTTDYVTLYWDNIQVEYDPYGDNESATFEVERPEGASIGDLTLPAGCQHFIYWDKGDWTALDAGFPFLSYSGKGWNESTCAELQRADSLWWWFRSIHFNPVIVPMNWRSADRSPRGQNRVLSGG